jgi:RNA polymerase sigma factor (sigma-70 family)
MGPEEEDMVDTRDEFVERALAEFEGPLIGYAMGIVKDLERARDVVQDTFIRLYQQDREKVSRGLKTWLFTVCRNRALDILRKEKRMVELDDAAALRIVSDEADPGDATDWDERVAQVMSALDRLSENQREVIRLKFQQGLSYKEITDVTGLTSGNVGFLLHTGLKRLRSMLPDDLLDNLNPAKSI